MHNPSVDPAITKFWKKTLTELAAVPMGAKVDTLHLALPYREYKVTLNSLGNVKIAGLLAIPVQGEAPAKPRPVIVTVPGYGGNQQGIMLSECQRGYAILQVFPRGQGLSEAFWKVPGGDKLTMELNHPDGSYYQGAYADVIRMIDFVVSRPDIMDSGRIALVGTSQGGGISLAVAALDPRIKTVVAHVPFLCNFQMAAHLPSLVKRLLDRAGKNNQHALNTLAYFDPYQLAPLLQVPVLMSCGGKDRTCPWQTIQSVYNRISSTKEIKFYPNLTHTSCEDFYLQTWHWLNHYLQ
ncbi:MAG: hypothetical protein EPN37_06340 [Chitinophagaceae bacterium]|nr:MAG: hypothetical protein EPN37_06340 [Chitinophagaceae bacterium]